MSLSALSAPLFSGGASSLSLLLCRPISTSCVTLLRGGGGGRPSDPRLWRNDGNPLCDPAGPLGPNDRLATHVRNRNPMNLERMRIGYKPEGFELDTKEVGYWNKLRLSITQSHTTAEIIHWTGRRVCQASTQEWPIRRFLYNCTDAAAVQAVGAVLGQRAIETGVCEVHLERRGGADGGDPEDVERMRKFVQAVRDSGLVLGEGPRYRQQNPHRQLYNWSRKVKDVKPWEYSDSQ